MICTWTSDAIYLVLPFSNLRWHWNLSKSIFNCYLHVAWHYSAAGKKSPNVYKSCPKRILLVKWKILTLLQKLPKMCWWFGQNTCCPGLWKVARSIKNRPIWSHCLASFLPFRFKLFDLQPGCPSRRRCFSRSPDRRCRCPKTSPRRKSLASFAAPAASRLDRPGRETNSERSSGFWSWRWSRWSRLSSRSATWRSTSSLRWSTRSDRSPAGTKTVKLILL